ncbi:hypothetical protein [Frankia tisae]|uniref:hypothetical protein n=1 Tax=Frankia tisae TaxID=2950104 RepID=UPI0021BEF130|nr:hypothetical protein [Frankia tisae]
MDDRGWLPQLISLVAIPDDDPHGRPFGLRFSNDVERARWTAPAREWADALERGESRREDDLSEVRLDLHNMCAYYSGAVRSGADPGSARLDAEQLPHFALEAVDGLPDDVLAMLGRMVRSSLGLRRVDDLHLARTWAEDVRATAWRLLVAAGKDP